MQLIQFKLPVRGILVCILIFSMAVIAGCADMISERNEKAKKYCLVRADKIALSIETALSSHNQKISEYTNDKKLLGLSQKVNKLGWENVSDEISEQYGRFQEDLALAQKSYDGIFITDSTGYIYLGSHAGRTELEGFSVAERRYFREAATLGKPVQSNLLISRKTKERIYVLSAPIYSGNSDFLGIIGLLVKAEPVLALVRAFRASQSQTGYAYMIDDTGMIIAHPKKNLEMNINLKQLEGLSAVTQAMIDGQRGAMKYTYKGLSKISGFSPISANARGWSVGFTINEDELMHIIR